MTQDTWQYQGRQSHGEWGHGTAPHTAPPSRPGRVNPPAPATLDQRASYVAYGAIVHLPPEQAGLYELRLQHGMLDDFRTLLAASPAAAHLSDEAYCEHMLGGAIGLEATRALRKAVAIVGSAPTLDDFAPGMEALAAAVKGAGLSRFARAMHAAANAEPPPQKPAPTVSEAAAAAGALGASAAIGEGIGWGRIAAGAAAVAGALPTAASLGVLLYPNHTAADDTLFDRDHPYGPNVFSKPPKDAKDKYGAKAPGKPGAEEGFKDPKTGEQWGRADNGKFGWVDADGNVWVPTGPGGLAHGGPHWDVQGKNGKSFGNVYPGGHRR